MKIRLATHDDFEMLQRHKSRHSKENGRGGDVIFAPSEVEIVSTPEQINSSKEALLKSVTTPGWMRLWILTDENEIYGDLTLVNRPTMPAALHRCLLMMGLERPVRSQGWGSKMIGDAITWAKEQPTLDWVTLHVFENNPRAKSLYKKFGFKEVGTTIDMFRAFGQKIDDTEMVLRLR